jgi:hypothetical protein
MSITEHTINDALAEVLSETRSLWRIKGIVRSENLGCIKGTAEQPDILVVEPSVSPVVVETEIMPARSLEKDALQRLGEQLLPSGRRILSSLAVRLPARLRSHSSAALKLELSSASDFEMALYTGENSRGYQRWPTSGWLRGNVVDMSVLIQSASIPPAVIELAADSLVSGVSEAAALLSDMAITHPAAIKKICEDLRQQDGEQTWRMATTILANALVFHESLARGPGDLGDVRTLDEITAVGSAAVKSAIIEEWYKILKVNYWPIFDIARRILEVIPADNAKPLLRRLMMTASELIENRLMRSHDLTGAVFQRLIADRKFLAAYYTTPAAAALLVGLAIHPERTPGNGFWSNPDDVKNLRVADFACGTGTLLSTAYQRISQLHEAAGGDAEALHPSMMAAALVGCDVLPAAAHLTASMLAGAHPTVIYNQSSIMTVAYGPQPGGSVALGSLELLDPQRPFEIIAVTAKAAEGMGETEKELWSSLPHESFDLVIMNPPFTRDTDHEAGRAETRNPMFAAFGSTADQQREMAQAAERLLRGTSAHGNAGEASVFLVLADRKLKNGGTLALVMPLSLMSGGAWEASRQLLRKSYNDLVFISIAGARDNTLSFSADTGMGEVLVIGRKTIGNSNRATFVVVKDRPASSMVGANAAVQINLARVGNLRKLEDGPVGGTPIHFGDDLIGYAMDAPLPMEGPWSLVRILDASLAQAAYQLKNKFLIWLPGMSDGIPLVVPISTVSNFGAVGPVDRDVNGNTPDGGIRGPFQIASLKTKTAPTYPVLWSHDAKRERCMEFEADSEGIVRQGTTADEDASVKKKAERVWLTASHCHFNRDFRFNSQSTAMQFTSRPAIGGRAWPSILLNTPDQEKALTLWGNSSLGLLLHWWHANKQQAGRGSIGVSSLDSLSVLDVTKLSKTALSKAVAVFDELKSRELRPVNEIDRDPVRHEIDTRLCIEVLGLPAEITAPDGPLALLRQKLALEPSIHGGKK